MTQLMKKALLLCLAAALVCFSLAGCAGNDNKVAANGAESMKTEMSSMSRQEAAPQEPTREWGEETRDNLMNESFQK